MLRVGGALPPDVFAAVRRRTIFEHCKWDPQVGDVATLAPFPLLLTRATWQTLAAAAEALARETLAAERELLARPELIARLSLPSAVRRRLVPGTRGPEGLFPGGHGPDALRYMRFDFHWTTEGWRISEVNSDVPGGFIEAGGYTQLMAEHYGGYTPAGDPGAALAEALRAGCRGSGVVAMVHATAYTDDRQVMIYLARECRRCGLTARLAGPDALGWREGRAAVANGRRGEPVDVVLRFYPAEWLPSLPRSCRWQHFFAGSRTGLANPGTALLTQSKRFPLTWDRLTTPLDAWRAWLPETRALTTVDWRRDEQWVLKPALGRVGEGIGLRGVTADRVWRKLARHARWFPGQWVAQRRFQTRGVETPLGRCYPCLGVFVVGGRAAGVYGRLAREPLVDERAYEVAVLVAEECDHAGPASDL